MSKKGENFYNLKIVYLKEYTYTKLITATDFIFPTKPIVGVDILQNNVLKLIYCNKICFFTATKQNKILFDCKVLYITTLVNKDPPRFIRYNLSACKVLLEKQFVL